MVVNVYVEGGIINDNVDATTINNSEAFRERSSIASCNEH